MSNLHITIHLAASEYAEGSSIVDRDGYNAECDDVLESALYDAIRKAYPGASVSVDTEVRRDNLVCATDGNALDDSIEAEIHDMIEEIGRRVLCGDLAPDVEPYMGESYDEDEVTVR